MAAPPSSPILEAANFGINPQTATVATPISVSEASPAAYNEAIGVLDPIAPYKVLAQGGEKQFPGERPLSDHFKISSCSERAYVPTPYNTPRTAARREYHLPEASSAREEAKPVLKKVAARLRGGGSTKNEKVYLRGGGPKKRRGGAVGNSRRKKAKKDKYSDVDQLLSDFKSPIFEEDANIKASNTILQTMIEQGESYPFDQMTGDEIATTAADFKLDGTYGRLDSTWMAQALTASQTRAAGGFDAYLASQFEEQWAEEDEEVSDEEVKEVVDSKNDKSIEKE
ncbi:hypothetical protein DSL72_003974 [Monilinia vaccinii-corymbosi]|uniref:ASX DEUBAD domain-containing protein n=1 Tax=Monilinia vaccinii-corymbosi TaxID=61207 RepID=A0A8A3NZB3_9HELO|nr:hypothetical protein DSL72_003974 [Monilinia vaccinii-corymbosi]